MRRFKPHQKVHIRRAKANFNRQMRALKKQLKNKGKFNNNKGRKLRKQPRHKRNIAKY